MQVTLEHAVELIKQKMAADAPIATYKEKPVQKGVGRFGPFIKWDNTFINVPKKYNFNALSTADISELIEEKLRKDKEKIIHNWASEGIRVEKARWGRSQIIKGRIKIELTKDVDAASLSLEDVKKVIAENAPKSKTKKTAKSKR
jgi:DNA topoisomerase-1